jgi:hypothetical protein
MSTAAVLTRHRIYEEIANEIRRQPGRLGFPAQWRVCSGGARYPA